MLRATLIAALVWLPLAACLPVTSKVPVGGTVGLKPDLALLGSWKAASSGGEPATIHFLKNSDGSMTAVLVTGDSEWSEYRLRVVQLGANRFINAQEISNNGESSHGPLSQAHIVLIYRIDGPGRITLFQMDDKATAAAIRAGNIAGEIEPGEDGDVRITAAQPALDAFMRTSRAAALFNKELVRLSRAS